MLNLLSLAILLVSFGCVNGKAIDIRALFAIDSAETVYVYVCDGTTVDGMGIPDATDVTSMAPTPAATTTTTTPLAAFTTLSEIDFIYVTSIGGTEVTLTSTSTITKVSTLSPTPYPMYTTSVVYTTQISTVSACDSSVTGCSVGALKTEIIPLYTTISTISGTNATTMPTSGAAISSTSADSESTNAPHIFLSSGTGTGFMVSQAGPTTSSSSAAASSTLVSSRVSSSTISPTILPKVPAKTTSATPSTTHTTTSVVPTTSTTSAAPIAVPTNPTPNPANQKIVTSAITALTGSYVPSQGQWTGVQGWIAANAYNDIMDYDHYTGTKTYQATYGAGLLAIATNTTLQSIVLSTDSFNDDQLWWCLAMLRAYTNYGHMELLTQTIKQWNQIGASSLLVASDQGTTPTKGGVTRNTQIPATCDVAGAVYWNQQSDSPITAISTSLYAQVAAWLFEITGDATYRTAADVSIAWLRRMMLDVDDGIMRIDSITITGCVKNFGSLTYNTGVYIGALTSLYRATGDASYLAMLTLTTTSSTTGAFGNNATFPLVVTQEADLVTSGDAMEWRDILFRNLLDFYVMSAQKGINATIQADTKAFFTANFNQIQKVARFGDLYAANWFGLLKVGTDWGTVSVMSVLLGAMMML